MVNKHEIARYVRFYFLSGIFEEHLLVMRKTRYKGFSL